MHQNPGDRPRTCVVVSYWTGRSARRLGRLLGQMSRIDAGAPFDVVVVCNGGDLAPLHLPRRFDALRPRVFDRPNLGFNIGAWEHGWRAAGGYDYYLFIQDDCFLKRPNWVARFEARFDHDRGIGLLGELVHYDRMTWDFVRRDTYDDFKTDPARWPEPVHPIDTYRALFDRRGIPWGDQAHHLPSIILFSSGRVLDEVGGFPYFGPSYREAVASEFAISRLVESRGYRIAKVTDYSFELIGHPQWSTTGKLRTPGLQGRLHEAWWKSKALIRRLIGPRRKPRQPRAAPAPAPK
jgi:hypothetical protein